MTKKQFVGALMDCDIVQTKCLPFGKWGGTYVKVAKAEIRKMISIDSDDALYDAFMIGGLLRIGYTTT